MREKIERRQNLDEKLDRLSLADHDRVNVVLTLAGFKRATALEIRFGKYITGIPRSTPDPEQERAIAATRNRQILRQMQLFVAGDPRKDGILYAARNREDAERLAQLYPSNMRGETPPEEVKELGILFGFPHSAVEAFKTEVESESREGPRTETVLKREDLPEEILNEEIAAFLSFILSKEHWREEMETVRRWAEVVKQRAPQLYARLVKEYRDQLEEYSRNQR